MISDTESRPSQISRHTGPKNIYRGHRECQQVAVLRMALVPTEVTNLYWSSSSKEKDYYSKTAAATLAAL